MKRHIEVFVEDAQGARESMEDSEVVSSYQGIVIFGVFDGHGGDQVSDELRRFFPKIIFEQICELEVYDIVNVQNAIKRAFIKMDQDLTYHKEVGSTAILAILIGKYLFFCNLGDSRAVLFTSSGEIIFETNDHKPEAPVERQRIEDAGGEVLKNYEDGPYRVDGTLAVSRAFGDMEFKIVKQPDSHSNKTLIMYKGTKSKVSPEPDITPIKLNESVNYNLILACDGLWDVMTTKEVVHFALKCPGPNPAARSLVYEAIDVRESTDNVTVMVATLYK